MTEYEINNLRVNAVTERVRTIDWSEYRDDERGIAWDSFEAVRCDKCRHIMVLSGVVDAKHSDIDPDAVLPPCGVGTHHGDVGPCADCTDCTGSEGIGVCTCEDAPCDGYVDACSGPAMNYFYPCPRLDVNTAALKIAHLPLCVIEFADGETGFALTGGGMDFSWQICAAYVACGYLPPTEFDLLKMGGMTLTGWHLDVWQAMRRSIDVHQNWLNNSLEKLDELKKWVEDKDAKSKAKNAAREVT